MTQAGKTQAGGTLRLPRGLGWLFLLFALALGVAGSLTSAAITDVRGKQAALEAATARRILLDQIGSLVLAASTADALPSPDALLGTLQQLEAGVAAWRKAAPPADRPHADLLTARIAEFVHLRREAVRLVRERGPDDARLFVGSEPVRANRLSLGRDLAAASAATADHVARHAAALAEARQHWQSMTIGLLAAVVLLAFLQVVRLARRPVEHPADSLPAMLDAVATGTKHLSEAD
ncbi:hypothetical protein [Azospirillum sp. sgz301742]